MKEDISVARQLLKRKRMSASLFSGVGSAWKELASLDHCMSFSGMGTRR